LTTMLFAIATMTVVRPLDVSVAIGRSARRA